MNDEIEIILQPSSIEVTEPLVADYVLPKATASVLGGVKIGANIDVDGAGTISVPIASESESGLVKVGSGLVINDGVLSSTETYTLPKATSTQLGGVCVDDTLDSESENPVQNKAVKTSLDQTNSNINSLSNSLDVLSNSISNVQQTLPTIQSDVTSIQTSVSSNTENITSLDNRVTSVEQTNISQGDAINNMTADIDSVIVSSDVDIALTDLTPSGSWSDGNLSYHVRGKICVIYVNLEGTLNLSAGGTEAIYTLPESVSPLITCYGTLLTNNGGIEAIITPDGTIAFENLATSSKVINYVKGTITLVL